MIYRKCQCSMLVLVGFFSACDGSNTASKSGGGGSTALATGVSETVGGSSSGEMAGGSAISGSTGTTQSSCSPGILGCLCYANNTCNATLSCKANICEACVAGTEGCACYGNGTCNASLSCLSNVCLATSGTGNGGGGGVTSTATAIAPGGSVGSGGSIGGGGVATSITGGFAAVGGASAHGSGPTTGGAMALGGAAPTGGTAQSTLTVAVGGANGTTRPPATGGSLATGGTTGMAGAPGCESTCSDPLVLDDFEDGNLVPCSRNGWASDWWLATDGYGLSVPTEAAGLPATITVPRSSSCRGLHIQGSGFTEWGTVVGVTFNNPDKTVARLVDISAYNGVTFWVKGSGKVRLQVATTETEVVKNGGDCVGEWPTCDDHHSGNWLTLASSWTNYKLSFASMLQEYGSGGLTKSDLQMVLGMYFQTPANTTFDLWLDDVTFY